MCCLLINDMTYVSEILVSRLLQDALPAGTGLGRFQVVLLLYCGCAWAADAMEMMLLSFLGPAVRCEWGLTASQEGLITSVVFLARALLSCRPGYWQETRSYFWTPRPETPGPMRSSEVRVLAYVKTSAGICTPEHASAFDWFCRFLRAHCASCKCP